MQNNYVRFSSLHRTFWLEKEDCCSLNSLNTLLKREIAYVLIGWGGDDWRQRLVRAQLRKVLGPEPLGQGEDPCRGGVPAVVWLGLVWDFEYLLLSIFPRLTRKTKQIWRMRQGKESSRSQDCQQAWKAQDNDSVIQWTLVDTPIIEMKKAENLGHERLIMLVISLTANCPAQMKNGDNLGHEQWIRLVISFTANCPAQMLGYFAGTCVSRWGGWSVHVVRGCRLVWHIPGDAVAPLSSLSGPSLSGQQ